MSSIIQRPRRITSESVAKELQPAVDLVGSSINTFMEEVYIAMTNNLGPTSNLNQEFKTITIEVDGSGIPKTNVAFRSNISGKVIGTNVIRAFLANPTNQPFIAFTENNGVVTIDHVSGLAADTEYQLVVLVIGS